MDNRKVGRNIHAGKNCNQAIKNARMKGRRNHEDGKERERTLKKPELMRR